MVKFYKILGFLGVRVHFMVLLMELMPLEEEMVQKTSWEDYKLLLVSCHGETKKFVRCAKVV